MNTPSNPNQLDTISPVDGDRVEVRNHFTGDWCSGFVVSDVVDNHNENQRDRHFYRIRRVSDGVVLPRLFTEVSIRTGP